MIAVLALTVFVDLMTAVAVGMVMAAMILLKRLSDIDPAVHSPLRDIAAHRPWIPPLEAPDEVLDGLYVVELHGSLFFGNAGPLQRKLEGIEHKARAVVLHMGDVPYLDQSGVYMLNDLIEDLHRHDCAVFIAEPQAEPAELMTRLGTAPGLVAQERLFDSAKDAVLAATRYLRQDSPAPESTPATEAAAPA
jgi:SulP family sulfate permease